MEVIILAPCLFHSTTAEEAAQAGCGTMAPAARPHRHTLWGITVEGPAHGHTETQTPGHKMLFCPCGERKPMDVLCCSFHSLFILQVFH